MLSNKSLPLDETSLKPTEEAVDSPDHTADGCLKPLLSVNVSHMETGSTAGRSPHLPRIPSDPPSGSMPPPPFSLSLQPHLNRGLSITATLQQETK